MSRLGRVVNAVKTIIDNDPPESAKMQLGRRMNIKLEHLSYRYKHKRHSRKVQHHEAKRHYKNHVAQAPLGKMCIRCRRAEFGLAVMKTVNAPEKAMMGPMAPIIQEIAE